MGRNQLEDEVYERRGTVKVGKLKRKKIYPCTRSTEKVFSNRKYSFQHCFDAIQTSTKVDLRKNEASPSDVVQYWQTAVRPTFHKRRGAIEEKQAKDEIVTMTSMKVLNELGFDRSECCKNLEPKIES